MKITWLFCGVSISKYLLDGGFPLVSRAIRKRRYAWLRKQNATRPGSAKSHFPDEFRGAEKPLEFTNAALFSRVRGVQLNARKTLAKLLLQVHIICG